MPASPEVIDARIVPGPLNRLPTPCVLVDIDRLDRNLAEFQQQAATAGVTLRPHAKAHKTPQIAERQLALGAVGLAVAKPSEARVFVETGASDVDIAFPVAGHASARAVAELARSARIAVHGDSRAGLRMLSRAAVACDSTIRVLVEIDGGLGRCGVPADDVSAATALAWAVDELPGLELDGVVTYAGMAVAYPAHMGRFEAGEREGRLVVGQAEAMRAHGLAVRRVIAGSTATAAGAASVPGVTEVRAGAYPFMDGAQLSYGTVERDRVALTVLATIVSRPSARRATIDAGSKTLSAAGPAEYGAYAVSVDGTVRITGLNEEHGMAELAATATAEIGTTVRLVPSYASAVVGLADRLAIVRGDCLVDVWRVAARGCST